MVVILLAARLGGQETKPAQPADKPVRTTATRAMVQHVAFAPDNATVMAWEWAGYARWNPETNKTVDRQPVIAKACAGTKSTPSLPRSEDGRSLVVSCGGKRAFFDRATGGVRHGPGASRKRTVTFGKIAA